jgi:hypothetical protein
MALSCHYIYSTEFNAARTSSVLAATSCTRERWEPFPGLQPKTRNQGPVEEQELVASSTGNPH